VFSCTFNHCICGRVADG